MMRRIERPTEPLKRSGFARGRKAFSPFEHQHNPDLALAYSNGYVTVEISHDALDAYVEMNGDVPIPIVEDEETGDRHTYDAQHRVRVVYDAASNIREIATRSRVGLFVCLNFTDEPDR